MSLEQKLERSEELLETNEQNKRKVEQSKRRAQAAESRTNAAQARQQHCQDMLQRAIAARNAAQQRASQEEGGSVPASYDQAVSDAETALRVCTAELHEAKRELIEASEQLKISIGEWEQSSQELSIVTGTLQKISEHYGLEMRKTQELMSMPFGEQAIPLMEHLGIGRNRVDDLRRRIAASLGIAMPETSDSDGYSVRARVLTRSGTNTLYRSRGGGGGGGGGGDDYGYIPPQTTGSGNTGPAAAGASAGYTSPYVKTNYRQPVTYTHPQTKERITKISNRTVYENRNLDPNMVIPAGTRRSNGTRLLRPTTNLELMRQGKAPFIPHTMEDGTVVLAQVELHHLTGKETQHSSRFFRDGQDLDGSMMEISHLTHDKYDRQLHLGTPSFRRGRRKEKTADGAKYDSFRRSYWKNRAKKFEETHS